MSSLKGEDDLGSLPTNLPEDGGEPHSDDNSERTAPSLLELILAQAPASPPPLASRIDGIVVGRVLRVSAAGSIHVTFTGAPEEGFPARAMATLREEDEGREVALMFEGGDPQRPVVMGKMVSPLTSNDNEAVADGRRVEIKAEQEIALRCGDASITLTREGKIVIRGKYLLSRSAGINRILGGSVEIN